jgi:protein TonB
MSVRTDILDEPEHLAAPFVGSVLFHAGLIGFLVAATVGHFFGTKVEQWGNPTGGGIGAVAVNAVASIPLPNISQMKNPVANDTESQVPAPPPKPKPLPKPKVTAPDANAIPLKSRTAKSRATQAYSQPNKWQEKQTYRENQLNTPGGAAASSPMFNAPGGGGVGLGTNSPFGTQLGYYATLLSSLVGRNWRTSDIDPRLQTAPTVTVAFTLLRDGTVPPASVKVVQSSGNRAIDFSALRAILDVGKFPPIPPQFTRDRADLELMFQLKR